MNILVIGKFYSEGFGLHIADTLKAMGHTVFTYTPGVKLSRSRTLLGRGIHSLKTTSFDLLVKIPSIRKAFSKGLFLILKRNQVDLTIVTHDFLVATEVDAIKSVSKAPVVLWMPDSISNCGKFAFLNAPFDCLFLKDPYLVKSFRADLNAPVYYLPECCNPTIHRPVALSDDDLQYYQCDIATAGNIYPNREAFFRNLSGYNVKIWGPPPPVWLDSSRISHMLMSKSVFNEEKAKAFSAAKIVINNLHPGEIWGVNCRAFEIPACGGFQVTNWRPALSQLFEPDKEIITFKDLSDLNSKIRYYLGNDAARRKIAASGYRRVLAEHTYRHRLTTLLETVFSGKSGFPLPGVAYSDSESPVHS